MNILVLLGKLAVSAFLLWIVTRFVEWDAMAARLHLANPWLIALGVLSLILQNVAATVRWRQIIHAIGASDPGLGPLLASYFKSAFLGQALPSTVGGDVLRCIHARGWNQTISQAVTGVLVERIVALSWLVAIGWCGLPWLWLRLGNGVEIAVAATVLAAWAGGVAFFMLLPSLPDGLRRIGVLRGLFDVALASRKLAMRPKVMAEVAITSLIGHALVFAAIWLLAKSLSLPLGFGEILVAMPLVILIGMLPISVSGWGTREGAMALALGVFGIAASDAVLLSILTGLSGIASSLPGMVLWLSGRRRSALP